MRNFWLKGTHASDKSLNKVKPKAQPKPMAKLANALSPMTTPRILVVDDDPLFGKLMKQVGLANNADLTYCRSLGELSSLTDLNFDVAIIDHDLGTVTGPELTSYLEGFTTADVPVVLVSQTMHQVSTTWPDTIKTFIHKSVGPQAILKAGIAACETRQPD